jgi:hypothetical protein
VAIYTTKNLTIVPTVEAKGKSDKLSCMHTHAGIPAVSKVYVRMKLPHACSKLLFRESVRSYFLVETPVFALIIYEWSYFVEVKFFLLIQSVFVEMNRNNLS